MNEKLTTDGYEQTRRKLHRLEQRLAQIEERSDLSSTHRARVIQSYGEMMKQYLREIKLYGASHSQPSG